MTAQQGRPTTIQAHHRQAGSRRLGDHQASIVMKARKEKHIGLLTHRASELRSRNPSSELGSMQESPAFRETTKTGFVGAGPTDDELPLRQKLERLERQEPALPPQEPAVQEKSRSTP